MVGNATENTYTDDSLLSRLDRALAKLEDGMSFAAAIVILFLMVFGTANALGRKFLHISVWGYTDLVQLFMVAFSFLAIAGMQRIGGHIRMELLVRQLRGRDANKQRSADWLANNVHRTMQGARVMLHVANGARLPK